MKRRSRTVSFRLSDEEYDLLKNISATRGARSVSEFTRSVACNANENAEQFQTTLRTLSERIRVLDRELQTLTEALQNAAQSTNSKNEESAE